MSSRGGVRTAELYYVGMDGWLTVDVGDSGTLRLSSLRAVPTSLTGCPGHPGALRHAMRDGSQFIVAEPRDQLRVEV